MMNLTEVTKEWFTITQSSGIPSKAFQALVIRSHDARVSLIPTWEASFEDETNRDRS